MSEKIILSRDDLYNLYVIKKLSTYKIARKFNCDATVIQKGLREYNLHTRSPKKRIDLSKDKLKKLYWEDGLSSYKIAKLFEVGRTTIYNKLIEYGIGTRPKKLVNISKNELERLYNAKKMPLSKIAELRDCSPSLILNKMKKYNLKRRNVSESNQTYPKRKFTGDQKLKSYMIGFRLGDLNVKSCGFTVFVKSSTTKEAQLNLIKEVYGKYGHFWVKKYGVTYNMGISLNQSFDFLVPKEDNIPVWILKNKLYFFAFLGGYTDAEGNIGVSQNRARFRIRTYDKNIIHQIYEKLNSFGINSKFGLVSKKGFYGTRKQNKNCFGVFVNGKEDLFKLLKFIKPHLRHKKRYNDLIMAENNILERNKKYRVKN